MPAPKPTLGYPSRSAAVVALRSQGLSTRVIAGRIGIPETTVAALEHSAGRSRARARRPAEANGRTILFSVDVLDSLRDHAGRRGVHVNTLVKRIVETVADEDLVDAILDDAHTLERQQ